MVVFEDSESQIGKINFEPTTYKYTEYEYASVIEYECRCGDKIKITGSELYCNRKMKEFTKKHKNC